MKSNGKRLAICLAATKSYTYALAACVRSIATAAMHHAEADFVFATDTSEECRDASKMICELLPEGWRVHTIPLDGMEQDGKDYSETAQMRIAKLQGAAFAFARSKVRPDLLWSVESDNLIPADGLRVLEWTLEMPAADGSPVYGVAAATYPNGLFLGGFGSIRNQINEDFLESERVLSRRLTVCLEECRKRLDDGAPEKEQKRMDRLRKRVKNAKPDGTIWEVIAKHGWRRRGWMDFAYPGIGEGAVVPSDWCGLGCTLMGPKALALADFAGYEGKGTQDLFLCWNRWHPAGVRIACVPHVACDHVKRKADGSIVHHVAYHEQDPEFRGHLRVRTVPWH